MVIKPTDKYEPIYQMDSSMYLPYAPMNFEAVGTRLVYVTKFIDIRGYDVYEISTNLMSEQSLYDQLLYVDDRFDTPKIKEYDRFEISFVTKKEK